jgi:hypothetical protein
MKGSAIKMALIISLVLIVLFVMISVAFALWAERTINKKTASQNREVTMNSILIQADGQAIYFENISFTTYVGCSVSVNEGEYGGIVVNASGEPNIPSVDKITVPFESLRNTSGAPLRQLVPDTRVKLACQRASGQKTPTQISRTYNLVYSPE